MHRSLLFCVLLLFSFPSHPTGKSLSLLPAKGNISFPLSHSYHLSVPFWFLQKGSLNEIHFCLQKLHPGQMTCHLDDIKAYEGKELGLDKQKH